MALEDIINGPIEASAPAAANAPQLIGGFHASQTAGPISAIGHQISMATGQEAMYFEGDELAMFVGLPYEQKWYVQRKLVEAGLLNTTFRAGEWDAATREAMRKALEYANQWGSTWGDVLDRLVQSAEVPPAGAPSEGGTLKPDKATLTQIIKQTFEAKIGRRPTPDEIDEMLGYTLSQYEAEEQAAFSLPEEVPTGTFTPGGAGPVEDVDPVARFQEHFEQQYAGAMARQDRLQDVRENINPGDMSGMFPGAVQGAV